MTGREFQAWLIETHKCKWSPIEGLNTTGMSVKIYCEKTQRTSYFSGPFGDGDIPPFVIKEQCEALFIDRPDEDQKEKEERKAEKPRFTRKIK